MYSECTEDDVQIQSSFLVSCFEQATAWRLYSRWYLQVGFELRAYIQMIKSGTKL